MELTSFTQTEYKQNRITKKSTDNYYVFKICKFKIVMAYSQIKKSFVIVTLNTRKTNKYVSIKQYHYIVVVKVNCINVV